MAHGPSTAPPTGPRRCGYRDRKYIGARRSASVSVCQLSSVSVREGEGICGINSNFFNAGFVRCDMYMYMYWYGMGMYARTRKPARSQRKQQQMTKINTNSTNEERNGTERNVKGPSEFRKEKGKHVEISEKDRFTVFALLSIRICICQQ